MSSGELHPGKLLTKRLRQSLGIVIASTLTFAFVDFARGQLSPILLLLKVVQLTVAIATLRLLSRERGESFLIAAGLANTALVNLHSVTAGIVVGDPITGPILCVAMMLGSAAMLPWPPWAQALSAVVAVAAMVTQSFSLDVSDNGIYPVVGVLVVAIASTWISRVYERSRAELTAQLTERRRMETGLRDSEARFHSAFDHAPVGMALVALDGRFVQVNRRLCQIVGYDEDELLKLDFQSITHPGDLGADLERANELLSGKIDFYHLEKRYIHKSGATVWGLLAGSVVRDEQGHPLYFVAQIEDITERKRTEEERDRYFDLSIDLLCVASTSGYFKQVNPSFTRLLGYSEQELLSAPLLDWVHPEDITATRAELGRLAGGNDTFGFTNRYRRKDGSYCFLDWNARASSDGLVYAVARDVTERRRAEDILQGTVDALSAHIAILDEAGRILAVNAAWKRFADENRFQDPSYGVGTSYLAVCEQAPSPEGQEAAHRLRDLLAQRSTAFELEYPCHSPDCQRWFVMHASLFQVDGAVRIAVAHENISRRKEAEQELLGARDQAMQASQLKSQFLATMSHEIRTPLAAIIGIADLLRETELSQSQREFADTIYDSSLAVLGLINEVLDLSKIEAGKLDLEHHRFDLRKLLGQIRDLFAVELRTKHLGVSYRIDEDVPPNLMGDSGRVRQIFTNLVGNAIKFTTSGEIRVHIAVASRTAASVVLACEVKDTGIGIAASDQRRIFEAFTQADSSTSRRFGGSGLGLSICRELIERMGGAIQLRSQLGEGTVISFTLRLDCEPAPAPALVSAAAVPSLSDGARVLLVEDNSVNQRVASRLLAKLGYTVELASSGREAIDLIASRSYDAVLMDCAMPDLDGYQTTVLIREGELASGRHLPIIALTADATTNAHKRCLAVGMDDFLAKPVTSAALDKVLRQWIVTKSAATPREALDLDQLLGRLGNDRNLLAELAQIFLNECPRMLEALRLAAAQGDPAAIERAAHTLKGAISNFSTGPAWAEAAALERAARDRQVGNPDDGLNRLEISLQPLCSELRQLIGPDPSPAT